MTSPWNSPGLLFLIGMLAIAAAGMATGIPDSFRVFLTVFSFFCLAWAWYINRRYIISPSGWKYPVSPGLRRNPRIRKIVELNDQRMSSGEGSLYAMRQIGLYLEEDEDPEVRKFAAKALAVWPSLYVLIYLRNALLRDENKGVRLTCLSVLEAVFDPGLGFFRVQARVTNDDIRKVFDETINELRPITQTTTEDPEIRQKTANLLDGMARTVSRI